MRAEKFKMASKMAAVFKRTNRVVTWKLAVDFCESCDSQSNL